MDRTTHRAVKNILHNELGITSEKVENLVAEFVEAKLEDRMKRYMESSDFEYKVKSRIDSAIEKIVEKEVKWQLRNIGLKVSITNRPDKTKPNEKA